MKALYHLPTNTLEQLPSMEKPTGDTPYFEIIKYNAHITSLQRIPCDPSCREIWTDKQVVEEGKDYRVTTALLKDEKYPFLAAQLLPFAICIQWKNLEEEAAAKAIEASEGYCTKDNHAHDCNCCAYEQGYIDAHKKLLSPRVEQDELWKELLTIVREGIEQFDEDIEIIAQAKKGFSLTKKITP